ncbi:MAG: site-specific integrase [Proteobacteria bacterium]|nr:site-specific integrase [Pseudomonadota bacterium]
MAREKGLYRRKDSPYWWVDVVLPDGRRVCQSTRLKVLEDAEEFLVRLKADAYEAARTGIPAEHNWQEAVVQYLEDCVGKRSLDYDKAHFQKLDPYLRGCRLRDLNTSTLRPFIQDRKQKDGVANGTINRALEVVRHVLNVARDDWGWIARVPKIRMLKEPKRRVRFLTEEEADRLMLALPEHMVPVVQFALATGCRMTEILRLEWRRVDLDRRVSWLEAGTTKNGEGRGVPLNRDAILALRSVQGQHQRWCFTYREKRMEAIGSSWKRSLKRAGIESFRFHDLRHTWASWHVMSGTNLQELMELGGWKSYEMVLRYAHLAPEHLSDAAARIERGLEIVTNDVTISLR